jgi:hypothetical protein
MLVAYKVAQSGPIPAEPHYWREPHTNIDPNQVAILIRWVCLFVSILFHFHLTNFSFWFFHLNTETKDWHQKFLQFVLRNLLNWCKCVGRNNLNNVLYPLLFLLFFVFYFLFFFISHTKNLICFFLIEMLIGFWNNLFNVGTIENLAFKNFVSWGQNGILFKWQLLSLSHVLSDVTLYWRSENICQKYSIIREEIDIIWLFFVKPLVFLR